MLYGVVAQVPLLARQRGGVVAVLEAADTLAAIGLPLDSGFAVITEQADTLSAEGALAGTDFIDFDAFSQQPAGSYGSQSWTHTPVGTPRGALVVISFGSPTDTISTVTYGGTAMTEVAGSPLLKSTGETGSVHIFFLGTGVPTGAQTVSVSNSGGVAVSYACYTVVAAGDTEVIDVKTLSSDSQADPSVTLELDGRKAFCALGYQSGQDASTGVTALADWTIRRRLDAGAENLGTFSYDLIGTADVTAGIVQTAEDVTLMAVAVAVKVVNTGSLAVTEAVDTLAATAGAASESARLLQDGTSRRLLEDGASIRLLEG